MSELIPSGHKWTRITGGSVTAKRFAELAAAGTVTNANAGSDLVPGVFEDSVTTTSAACTVIYGPCVVEVDCAGTVTAGEKVECDSNGKAVTQTTGIARGLALTTATDGVIEIFLYAPTPRIADFTDSTTGTAGTTLAAGVGVSTVTIPLTSLATGLSTSAIDLLTAYTPGYKFKLLSFDWVTTVAGTGTSASQTFNLEIGTTNVTGGVLNVTLASTDTIGKITNGTAITAANTGTAADTISIEMAASGTVFTAGAGYFVIKIQNMDTADAVASFAKVLGQVGVTY